MGPYSPLRTHILIIPPKSFSVLFPFSLSSMSVPCHHHVSSELLQLLPNWVPCLIFTSFPSICHYSELPNASPFMSLPFSKFISCAPFPIGPLHGHNEQSWAGSHSLSCCHPTSPCSQHLHALALSITWPRMPFPFCLPSEPLLTLQHSTKDTHIPFKALPILSSHRPSGAITVRFTKLFVSHSSVTSNDNKDK